MITGIDTLLVEESAAKVDETLRALKDGGIHTVYHSADPRLAQDYLLGDASPPIGRIQLVILELLLPQPDRLELLTALRRDRRTHSIPSIVLAALDRPRDIARCYASGANIVIRRPDDYAKLVEKVQAIAQWFLNRMKSREPLGRQIVIGRSRDINPTRDDTFASVVRAAN